MNLLITLLLFTSYNFCFASNDEKFFLDPLNAGFPIGINKIKPNSDMLYLVIHEGTDEHRFQSLKQVKDFISVQPTKNIDLGHVQLAWSCKLNGELVESGIGFTADIENNLKELIRDNEILNALEYSTSKHRLEGPHKITEKINNENSKTTVIPIPANGKCEKVLSNVWNFINNKNKHYSLFEKIGNDNTFNCSSSIVKILKPLQQTNKKQIQSSTFSFLNNRFKYLKPSDVLRFYKSI